MGDTIVMQEAVLVLMLLRAGEACIGSITSLIKSDSERNEYVS